MPIGRIVDTERKQRILEKFAQAIPGVPSATIPKPAVSTKVPGKAAVVKAPKAATPPKLTGKVVEPKQFGAVSQDAKGNKKELYENVVDATGTAREKRMQRGLQALGAR